MLANDIESREIYETCLRKFSRFELKEEEEEDRYWATFSKYILHMTNSTYGDDVVNVKSVWR